MNLILVHFGDTAKSTIIESLFQTLLFNDKTLDIHILVEKQNVNRITTNVDSLSNTNYSDSIPKIHIHALETYLTNDYYTLVKNAKTKSLDSFRNGFWIHTTSRFILIDKFVLDHNLQDVFHIENDVMMYQSFKKIIQVYSNTTDSGIWYIRDSPNRVIPSIVFFKSHKDTSRLVKHIVQETLARKQFVNDMDLLGSYSIDCFELPTSPGQCPMIFDGAAIGQYLGGIDCRNLDLKDTFENKLVCFNRTEKFVNETSVFKPDTAEYSRKRVLLTTDSSVPLDIYICKKRGLGTYPIANIHVHSKMMWKFSSIFNLEEDDIITTSRIIKLVDFLVVTQDILDSCRDMYKNAANIIVVSNFKSINFTTMNRLFKTFSKISESDHIRLCIHSSMTMAFQESVLGGLSRDYQYTLYIIYPGDMFDERYICLLSDERILHVYAQYLDITSNKTTLLPVGIEESRVAPLYKLACTTYYKKKTKGCVSESAGVSESESLHIEQLERYTSCVCKYDIHDAHRVWECLYLGVIPIIIPTQSNKALIENLKSLQIPFSTERSEITIWNIYNTASLKLSDYF